MSDPQGLQPQLVDAQALHPRPSPHPIQDHEQAGLLDDNGLLVGKGAAGIRAPKPASLNWGRMKDGQRDQSVESSFGTSGSAMSDTVSPISPVSSSEALRTPNLQRHPYKQPPSPGGTSQLPPRLHSPASQIFERSVQEDMVPPQASPSIPAHIRTENYIPPVLEASSAAITDDHLDPDSVEIVTHSLHQPAAGGVTGSATEQSLSSSIIDDHGGPHQSQHSELDEMSSTYGALDTADVRRLSFISFADVVNAEHAGDPSQSTPASGNPVMLGSQNRSPSPLRSPGSSHGLGTSPPTSIATSFKGLEMSPSHGVRGAGSPLPLAQSPVSSSFGGELNVETMRQALRRTGSGDLGGAASQAASAIGNDEVLDRSF
ncbi:hypothetical protein NUU61_000359 [Penicillium alfredii]|uniref:Uncharacterized protein n=1 Tax=Penicillium alfredii TaxID=1506179 RepID=A0A9W9KQL0_9EURO|nr:uncharacterized protein NUU61_000359 [Penicillium alfredii]KAJ5114600.1 hypothetical protein NUU61_000359 [Penicillium alfredii]